MVSLPCSASHLSPTLSSPLLPLQQSGPFLYSQSQHPGLQGGHLSSQLPHPHLARLQRPSPPLHLLPSLSARCTAPHLTLRYPPSVSSCQRLPPSAGGRGRCLPPPAGTPPAPAPPSWPPVQPPPCPSLPLASAPPRGRLPDYMSQTELLFAHLTQHRSLQPASLPRTDISLMVAPIMRSAQ